MPSDQLQDFINTFGGDSEAVRPEIRNYWDEHGLTTPVDLYSHLMDTRVARGEISRTRATTLENNFRDSFAPEHTTGYFEKHRAPLIDGLTQLYTDTHPGSPVFRVEGDVGNLGGLNTSMMDAARRLARDNPDAFRQQASRYNIGGSTEEQVAKLGRMQADHVIGTMSGIVRKALGDVASSIQAVRKGGDEISFVVVPKKGQSLENVRSALDKAQNEVSRFAEEAGLQDIPHLKALGNSGKAGVGIGLAAVDARDGSALTQQQLLDNGILLEKSAREKARTGRAAGPGTADIEHVEHVLDQPEYRNVRPAVPSAPKTVLPEAVAPGLTPEESRLNQMRNQLTPNSSPLSVAEERAYPARIPLLPALIMSAACR